MDLDRRGCREALGEVGGGEIIMRIYFMNKNYFQYNKNEKYEITIGKKVIKIFQNQ